MENKRIRQYDEKSDFAFGDLDDSSVRYKIYKQSLLSTEDKRQGLRNEALAGTLFCRDKQLEQLRLEQQNSVIMKSIVEETKIRARHYVKPIIKQFAGIRQHSISPEQPQPLSYNRLSKRFTVKEESWQSVQRMMFALE